ncbi:MAG: helix-turn-helix domain-containing protein [Thermoleophilaceae bacterium]
MATEERVDRRAAAEAAILAAASDLLEEGSSFAGLSVEQIATRAGIGRTAFYFYFRDKSELLMRLTGEVTEALYEEADRWWHGDAELADSLERIVAVYLEHKAVLRVVSEAAGYDDDVRAFWVALINRFVDATRERIEADQRAGSAVEVPAAETAMALVWMCERTLYHFSRDTPDADREPVTDALVQIFRRSIYGRLPE